MSLTILTFLENQTKNKRAGKTGSSLFLAAANSRYTDIDAFYLSCTPSFMETIKIKRIPIDIQILNFLAKQPRPVTIDQIDDEIDCYPNIIASYLKDLTEKGMVTTISDLKPKVYFLAT
jgi:hypothetical protein